MIVFKTPKKSALTMLLLVMAIAYYGCTPQKKLRYLQQKESQSVIDSMSTTFNADDYKLKTGDQLYISVYSNNTELLPQITERQQASGGGTGISTYLISYTVNDSGIIEVPLVGAFEVGGLTMKQTKKIITEEVRKNYSLDAEVTLKLVNFRISVIGEVNSPGVIQVYDSKINILEAIANAGDLTTFGNRENIMIIREGTDKKYVNYLDISSMDLIHSDYYYLQPGDVIYVQSLNAKTFGFAQVQWGLIFSSISTFIALMALFAK